MSTALDSTTAAYRAEALVYSMLGLLPKVIGFLLAEQRDEPIGERAPPPDGAVAAGKFGVVHGVAFRTQHVAQMPVGLQQRGADIIGSRAKPRDCFERSHLEPEAEGEPWRPLNLLNLLR